MKCVYKFSCLNINIKEFYIGYTENFDNRKNKHRNACKIERLEWYKFINLNGGFDNWEFSILEEECEEIREKYWIKLLKPELNTIIPGRTVEEYNEDNKEKHKQRRKQYRKKNKEKIKEYRENNKEKLKELGKKYYENHKEKYKEKINCPNCSKSMNKWSLARHLKNSCKNKITKD